MLNIRRTPSMVGVLFIEHAEALCSNDAAVIGRIEEDDAGFMFFRPKASEYALRAATLDALLARVEALEVPEPALAST